MDRKFQYSKFFGTNKEEQFVIRADTWAEFLEAKTNIENLFFIKGEEPQVDKPTSGQTPNKTGPAIPVTEFQKTCYKCGAEMIINPKTNKIFCKEKCWLKEAQ